MRRCLLLASAATAVLAFAPAWAAQAQTAPEGAAVEEVIVTATKTGDTNLQKTALSVAVVRGEDLVKSNIRTIKDLTLMVPSLVVTTNNANPQIYVRGVGGAQGLEGDVSIYFDGVYLSRPSVILQTNFNDLERVEVLQGPQGTVFGRNSAGGAINFISKAPSRTFTFNNTLQLGNYSLFDEAFSISGPLTDKVQGRLSFSHFQHSGYLMNVNPVGGRADAANRSSVRATVRWEPSDKISNTVRADYLYVHEKWGTNLTFLSPTVGLTWSDPILEQIQGQYDKINVWNIPYQTEKAFGLSNDFSWKLNDNLTLRSQSAVRTDFADNRQAGATSVKYQSIFSRIVETQYSQEFNIINKFGPLSGVVGAYYFNEKTKFTGVSVNFGGTLKVPNPAGGSETFQVTHLPVVSKAVFFEETYHFTPEFSFTLGARYTKDQKVMDTQNSTFTLPVGFPAGNYDYLIGGRPLVAVPSPAENPYIRSAHVAGAKPPLRQDASATTPKAAFNWQITPDALLYVSASKGFKSGGFSSTARQDQGSDFGPEKVTAYELGAKTDWLAHTMRVNLSLFRYNWTGQQFNAEVAPQLSVVANAGASRTNGFEANIIWKPIPDLMLTASTTLLDSKYTDFPTYTFPGGFRPLLLLAKDPSYNVATGTYNARGKHLVNAPKASVNFTAQKDWKLGRGANIFLRGEWSHTSRVFFDPTNIPIASRPPTRISNASAGYTPANAHWDFVVWVKNIEGERYVNGIAAPNVITAPVTAPRTFGVRVNYNY
jgi:iron complex outermembrane receptor protein